MEKFQIISILRLVAFFLTAVLATGCSEGVTQEQTQEQETAQPSAKAESDEKDGEANGNKKPDEKEALDFTNTSSDMLIKKADEALRSGDIEMTHEAIAEVRSRKNVGLRSKMEIARILFGTGQMKGAAQVYDEVLEQRPDIKPQLWQRGLALYYAEEFEKGVDQFDTHQTYNSQDVENSVWQLLCQARLTSVEDARKSMIQIESDSRVPMEEVFNMFAGTGTPEEVITASGYDAEKVVRNGSTYHGWLYVGLFHEMMGDEDASIEAMKTALKCKPIIPSLMGNVAEGHLRVRNAYPTYSE